MARIGFSTGEEEKKTPEPGSQETPGKEGTSGAGTSGAGTPAQPEKPAGSAGKYRPNVDITDYLTGRGGNKDKSNENEAKAETALLDLKNDYIKTLQDQYNYSADKLKAEKDAAMRENWILQQQAEANLPERLAAGGINGGATETSLAALRAQYQGNRNDIQSGYMDNLGELEQKRIAGTAEAEKSYNERWLEYLLSLAQAEKTAEYNR